MESEKDIPAGLLTEADINLIKDNYKIDIDPDDLKQYKLCQVIKHLEEKLRKLGNS